MSLFRLGPGQWIEPVAVRRVYFAPASKDFPDISDRILVKTDDPNNTVILPIPDGESPHDAVDRLCAAINAAVAIDAALTKGGAA